MNGYIIIERHGQFVAIDTFTHDLEVFNTRAEAESYVVKMVTLVELNTLILESY